MNDVIIRSDNHSFAYLDCDYGIIREMSDRYTFKPDGYMFTPAYKAGVWNGEIRLVDIRTGRFAKGLVPDIIDSLEASGYNVSLARGDFDSFRETHDMVDVDSLKLGFEPYDYQIAGVKRILTKKRQVILSPTGSGKSLLLYLTVRSLVGKKILIIVPNISLVSQLYSDFEDYAKNDDSWDVADNCQKIAEGASKEVSKNAVIATWQSIYTIKDKRWFEQYEAVFVDECHLAKAKSITGIMDKCINAGIRAGVSGTLDGSQVNELVLKGLFGPIHRVAKTSDLIDTGVLTDLRINVMILKHDPAAVKSLGKLQYTDELDYLVRHERRNKLICKLAKHAKGNTLILFQFVEKHGKVLEKMLKDAAPDRKVFFVYGGVPGEERENIRKIMESQPDAIICASYQTYSTGVNLKNLHNIIFASPSKGRVRIFQSIGRGLRKHESKDICTLYDIADDIRGTKKALNHTLKHMMVRLEAYYSEGFNVKCVDIDL